MGLLHTTLEHFPALEDVGLAVQPVLADQISRYGGEP